MGAALGIVAGYVGFCCLIYAAKGSHGTRWDGNIAPGPVLKALLMGDWPYGAASSSSTGPAAPIGPVGPVSQKRPSQSTPGGVLA